ncbi:hypothetical protein GGX14DRAFT_403420 [Mycena pura]|uniref:Uncharacterized protein n=1 Tax=Mycena pura TaxID=153505 RepID=A0AAD6Y8G1_9AGAR|nr:hypothetical protein GGX14DRAFT_403420 [Mycena pura]
MLHFIIVGFILFLMVASIQWPGCLPDEEVTIVENSSFPVFFPTGKTSNLTVTAFTCPSRQALAEPEGAPIDVDGLMENGAVFFGTFYCDEAPGGLPKLADCLDIDTAVFDRLAMRKCQMEATSTESGRPSSKRGCTDEASWWGARACKARMRGVRYQRKRGARVFTGAVLGGTRSTLARTSWSLGIKKRNITNNYRTNKTLLRDHMRRDVLLYLW